MNASRRDLIALGLLLVLVACQVIGALHLGHNHDVSQLTGGCVACLWSHSPSIQSAQPLFPTAALVTDRTVNESPIVAAHSQWRLPSSPRSPPANDIL